MRALQKSLLVTALGVAISVFMFADVSQANGHPVTKVKVNVRAELESSNESPELDADGQVRRHKEARIQDEVTTIKKDEFKGMVKIPIDPASALGIVNEVAAQHADIRVILSRNGSDYAECLLEFAGTDAEDEDDDERAQAHYGVHVRLKKEVVKEKKGMCILNNGSHGVPDAQAGDVATATLVRDPNNRGVDVDFLQGAFELP